MPPRSGLDVRALRRRRRADPLRRAAAGHRGPRRPPGPRQLRRSAPTDGAGTWSRPRPSRSSPPTAPGARSRPLADAQANGTGRGRHEDRGLGGPRVDPLPGAGDDPLRRQHLLRRRHPLRRLDAGARRRHGHPQPRPGARRRAGAAAHPPHPPPPRPHPGPRLLRPRLPAPDRAGDLGPGLARGLAARPHRPLHLGAALAGRGARAALRRLLPPLPGGRVGDRPGADPRRLGHPPRPDPRLPDRRRRLLARLHPRPRAGARRRPRGARRGLDLRLRARPRRLAADPRRPVLRRRVPRPPRLGPLGARPHARLRPPHRRRAHRPLPPRPAPLRRASSTGSGAKPASAGRSWAATRRAVELGAEGAEYELPAAPQRPPPPPERTPAGATSRDASPGRRRRRRSPLVREALASARGPRRPGPQRQRRHALHRAPDRGRRRCSPSTATARRCWRRRSCTTSSRTAR